MTQLPEPETTNSFPNCVAMKLHFNAVKGQQQSPLASVINSISRKPSTLVPQLIDLSLTINFSGEQEMEVPGIKRLGLPDGIVTFGLRRGKLQLSLQNCKIPLDKVTLNGPLELLVDIEIQEEKGTEFQVGVSGGGTLSEKPSATTNTTAGVKISNKSSEKIKTEVSQVLKTGSEENPAWVFEVKTGKSILEGGATEKLGTIQVNTNPCTVKATFKVRKEDIRLTWGRVGWTDNVTRNKLAVIEPI